MPADRTPPTTPARPKEAGSFGDALRRAREARGIALDAVADRTRIAPHHLEALERSDLDALPPGPFGRSYVRTYAEVLGIDAEPILAAYRAQELRRGMSAAESDRRMLEQLSQLAGRGGHAGEAARRARRAAARAAVAAVAIAVVAASGWMLASRWPRRTIATGVPHPAPRPSSPGVGDRTRPQATKLPVAPKPEAREEPTPAPETPAPRVAAESATQSVREPRVSPPTDSLSVASFGVGTGVADRRLVGRADRFPEGTRVVFWTEVLGGQPGHVIRHTWFQGGRAVMRADLPVRGPHWRTHSSLVLPRGSAGPWTVEARTSDGRLLARNDFVCERARGAGQGP